MAYYVEQGTGRIVQDPPLLSPQDFMDRFPAALVQFMTNAAKGADAVGGAVSAELLRFQVVKGVDPTDPRTMAGAEAMVNLGVWAGVIAPGDAPGVLAAILAPAPEPPQWIPLVPPTVIG